MTRTQPIYQTQNRVIMPDNEPTSQGAITIDLAYQKLWDDITRDEPLMNSEPYQVSNDVAIQLLCEAHYTEDVAGENVTQIPDAFGAEIGGELQSLLIMAFIRSPRLAEYVARLMARDTRFKWTSRDYQDNILRALARDNRAPESTMEYLTTLYTEWKERFPTDLPF